MSIPRYLGGTIHRGLLLQLAPMDSPFFLRVYIDFDWASDPNDRRLTSRFYLFLGPNLVSWSSKKQSLVSRSSAEAKYRGMANATTDLL